MRYVILYGDSWLTILMQQLLAYQVKHTADDMLVCVCVCVCVCIIM